MDDARWRRPDGVPPGDRWAGSRSLDTCPDVIGRVLERGSARVDAVSGAGGACRGVGSGWVGGGPTPKPERGGRVGLPPGLKRMAITAMRSRRGRSGDFAVDGVSIFFPLGARGPPFGPDPKAPTCPLVWRGKTFQRLRPKSAHVARVADRPYGRAAVEKCD
ncbi:hypothetical protein NL676_032363 [Syzygium grande]|nr:hypothetical protein NL676_032363 [Syzygium grande]